MFTLMFSEKQISFLFQSSKNQPKYRMECVIFKYKTMELATGVTELLEGDVRGVDDCRT